MFVLAQFRIHLALSQKSLYTPGKSRILSQKMSIECKIFLHITADLTGTSRNLFAVLCLEGKHCISDSTKCASRNSRIHKEKSRQLPCSDRRQYKPFKEKIISIEDVYWVLFRDGKNWITYVRGCPFEKKQVISSREGQAPTYYGRKAFLPFKR